MKFERKALIASLRERIATLEAAAAASHLQQIEKYEASIQHHLDTRDLKPLINLLRRAHERDVPLTGADFKNALGSKVSVGYDQITLSNVMLKPGPPKATKPAVSEHLALIQFLELTEDEYITSSGLATQGFRYVGRLLR